MSERSEEPKARRRVDWKETLNAVAAISTFAAAAAAAYSAWASWQTIEQTRQTQLLDRRVAACFEIEREAAAQLASLQTVLSDQRNSDDWCIAVGRTDCVRYTTGGYVPFRVCSGTESDRAGCEAAQARLPQRMNAAQRSIREMGRSGFEAERTFDVIGPDDLAAAERELVTRVSATTNATYDQLTDSDGAMLTHAIEAQQRFHSLCRTSVSGFR